MSSSTLRACRPDVRADGEAGESDVGFGGPLDARVWDSRLIDGTRNSTDRRLAGDAVRRAASEVNVLPVPQAMISWPRSVCEAATTSSMAVCLVNLVPWRFFVVEESQLGRVIGAELVPVETRGFFEVLELATSRTGFWRRLQVHGAGSKTRARPWRRSYPEENSAWESQRPRTSRSGSRRRRASGE